MMLKTSKAMIQTCDIQQNKWLLHINTLHLSIHYHMVFTQDDELIYNEFTMHFFILGVNVNGKIISCVLEREMETHGINILSYE